MGVGNSSPRPGTDGWAEHLAHLESKRLLHSWGQAAPQDPGKSLPLPVPRFLLYENPLIYIPCFGNLALHKQGHKAVT